jgi:hypothetical protein
VSVVVLIVVAVGVLVRRAVLVAAVDVVVVVRILFVLLAVSASRAATPAATGAEGMADYRRCNKRPEKSGTDLDLLRDLERVLFLRCLPLWVSMWPALPSDAPSSSFTFLT